MSSAPRVSIRYRRLPDCLRVYDQRIVAERDDVVVTLSEPIEIEEPLIVDGRVALETGSLAVWFTFPGTWHDIGRFHRADRSYSGLYANILTPVAIEGHVWRTTDLFLDVWWPAGGSVTLLDEDELEVAVEREHLAERTAARARAEADHILTLARQGRWPPPVVREWTLARSLRELEEE